MVCWYTAALSISMHPLGHCCTWIFYSTTPPGIFDIQINEAHNLFESTYLLGCLVRNMLLCKLVGVIYDWQFRKSRHADDDFTMASYFHCHDQVGHQIVVSYAECMGLPLFRRRIQGSTRQAFKWEFFGKTNYLSLICYNVYFSTTGNGICVLSNSTWWNLYFVKFNVFRNVLISGLYGRLQFTSTTYGLDPLHSSFFDHAFWFSWKLISLIANLDVKTDNSHLWPP